MKKYQYLFTVLCSMGIVFSTLFIVGANYSVQSTQQSELELLRAQANENASLITLTSAGDYDNKPSTAVPIRADNGGATVVNRVGVIACAGAAADKTFTVTYWAYRAGRGPAKKICSVAYTTGTQAVVKYPHDGSTATSKFWADTGTVTSYWMTGIFESANDGDNGIFEVSWDMEGNSYLYAEVTNADGSTGAEAGNVSVYWFYW